MVESSAMTRVYKVMRRDRSTESQPGGLDREPQGVDGTNASSIATPQAGREGLGSKGLEGAIAAGSVGQSAMGVAEGAVQLADKGQGGVGEGAVGGECGGGEGSVGDVTDAVSPRRNLPVGGVVGGAVGNVEGPDDAAGEHGVGDHDVDEDVPGVDAVEDGVGTTAARLVEPGLLLGRGATSSTD